jgi:hypothetical protein
MTTPDAVWKAKATAAEDFDRLQAQSMAALPVREIRAESLEAYWREWESLETGPDGELRDIFPPVLMEEIGWLRKGEGHVRLPDGTRWVLASARLTAESAPNDNRFFRRLHALLLEHQGLRQPHGSARTTILLEADTLDIRRVFCTECRAWCDLQADAEEADRTLGPWPGGAEWRSRIRREED